MTTSTFHAVDYVVFALMLLVSTIIGIYHGCIGSKQQTTDEYLMGNREMKYIPVTLSLLVSFLSAVTLLGVPGEIYTYGAMYSICIFSFLVVMAVSGVVFLPIFHNLRLTSVNEYLELRFSGKVRRLATIISNIYSLVYSSIAMYIPALALEVVVGVPLTVSIVATGVVCTFYTALGGLKAVVWTDVFQALVIIAGLLTVLIVGAMEVGGFGEVWNINKQRGRLNFFDFDPDPKTRNTFWSLIIGKTITEIPTWATGQAFVQRYLAIKSIKSAKRALWLNAPLLIFVVALCCLDGVVIFATYAGCDLKESKRITANDQVLAYFVIDKLGYMRGVPGLFVACLFSGSLSTVSSLINGIVTITLEDVVLKRYKDLTDREATKVSKMLVVVYGSLTIGGAFVVRYAGTMVLQLASTVAGIFGAPMFTVYVLGIFVRRANHKGVCVGALCGVAFGLWLKIGAMIFPPDRQPGSISIRECPFYNATTYANSTDNGIISKPFVGYSNPIADLYSLSYLWYAPVTISITFVFGIIFSLILETDEDRSKTVGDELLFNIPKYFKSFLPGHKKKCSLDENKLASRNDGENDLFEKNDNSFPMVEHRGNYIIANCNLKENIECT